RSRPPWVASALAKWQEILRAFDGLAEAAEEFLQILVAFDEVDIRGVDHEQIRSRVAKEEMLVGVRDSLHVVEGDLRFGGIAFLRDALAEYFGFGLEIDDQVGVGNRRSEHVEEPLV